MKREIKEWAVERVRFSDVAPMPDNERHIEKRNMEGLRACIEKFGLVELPVFNRSTGHLIAGHQRFYTLKEMGRTESDMIVVELSDEDEVAANLALNNPHIQGEWTEGASNLLQSLEADDISLYHALNMDALQRDVNGLMPKIPDVSLDAEVPMPDPEWDTRCPCCGNKWLIRAEDVVVE